jgi:RNA polymerase sigma-70 factor (ECF subfamily)
MVPPTDADLDAHVRALLDGGQHVAAATAVIRVAGPRILGYLAAVLRDEAVAGEVFSMFCEDLWRGMAGFRGESSVRAWSYRIAWHAALRHLRDPYRKRTRPLVTGEIDDLAAEVRTTTAMHLRAAAQDALVDLRASLGPEDQTLLILRVDRDLSWSEIAGVLGEPEPTLRKRFERLKERLRRAAVERGLVAKE